MGSAYSLEANHNIGKSTEMQHIALVAPSDKFRHELEAAFPSISATHTKSSTMRLPLEPPKSSPPSVARKQGLNHRRSSYPETISRLGASRMRTLSMPNMNYSNTSKAPTPSSPKKKAFSPPSLSPRDVPRIPPLNTTLASSTDKSKTDRSPIRKNRPPAQKFFKSNPLCDRNPLSSSTMSKILRIHNSPTMTDNQRDACLRSVGIFRDDVARRTNAMKDSQMKWNGGVQTGHAESQRASIVSQSHASEQTTQTNGALTSSPHSLYDSTDTNPELPISSHPAQFPSLSAASQTSRISLEHNEISEITIANAKGSQVSHQQTAGLYSSCSSSKAFPPQNKPDTPTQSLKELHVAYQLALSSHSSIRNNNIHYKNALDIGVRNFELPWVRQRGLRYWRRAERGAEKSLKHTSRALLKARVAARRAGGDGLIGKGTKSGRDWDWTEGKALVVGMRKTTRVEKSQGGKKGEALKWAERRASSDRCALPLDS